MSFQTPQGRCTIRIRGLGELDGFEYSSGVKQFCGIPYASLTKRWTRSTLETSWPDGHHDGTRLGYVSESENLNPARTVLLTWSRNDCPRPGFEDGDADDLVPVPPAAHFPDRPTQDELTGLVMNIVTPADVDSSLCPVMVYVHGGSLLYGGANLPIFDAVNLVTRSIRIGKPIICVNFNYRVGLGGFLASEAIARELREDGHRGCGNFGFTDQQVAFEWVQAYIGDFGGDKNRVTAVGESAGGISISNQLLAASPPRFHRAVCMSGLAVSIPPWTVQQHEKLFVAVCNHFQIDPNAANVLALLRQIPEAELADATPAIQGVASGTGNPCLDGHFYARDPLTIHQAPSWLEGYMCGDTYHEGVIFHLNLLSDTFESVRNTLNRHIDHEETLDAILSAYDLEPDLEPDVFLQRVEHMCGDAIFKIPNFVTAMQNQRLQDAGNLSLYHFDQLSRLQNVFEGTAYHAHELLYLFGNLTNEMNDAEQSMTKDFMTAWIKFVHGIAPWEADQLDFKVWGPLCKQAVLSVEEDEAGRRYKRMEAILAMEHGQAWKKWLLGIDDLVNKRSHLGQDRRR